MTTKQQEREALAKIKEIINGLGEGSYVATAFEGCYEIAIENIDNDFACSMKQRYESESKRREEAERANKGMADKVAKAEMERDAAREALHEITKNREDEIAELSKQLAEAKAQRMPELLHAMICDTVAEDLAALREDMEVLADKIVRSADHPQTVLFQESVAAYKARKERREVYEQIITGLSFVKTDAEKEGSK